MAAVIDLRRDLPKVRAQYDAVIAAQSKKRCEYAAPCVVGAMVNPRKRKQLDCAHYDDTMVGTLLEEGDLRAPPEQHHDLKKLQQAFDSGDRDHFELTLKSVEARYLSEQSA